ERGPVPPVLDRLRPLHGASRREDVPLLLALLLSDDLEAGLPHLRVEPSRQGPEPMPEVTLEFLPEATSNMLHYPATGPGVDLFGVLVRPLVCPRADHTGRVTIALKVDQIGRESSPRFLVDVHSGNVDHVHLGLGELVSGDGAREEPLKGGANIDVEMISGRGHGFSSGAGIS